MKEKGNHARGGKKKNWKGKKGKKGKGGKGGRRRRQRGLEPPSPSGIRIRGRESHCDFAELSSSATTSALSFASILFSPSTSVASSPKSPSTAFHPPMLLPLQ
ncbi:uncharacterized protein DS421_15g511060 [Arachis hypogaea]|nr:uncharacterized protein DS421_15g511060 [Arachis hypogaea]